LSRNKKKKKVAGQNLSLSERLERNWEGEKWEAFVSLYMRDRNASDRGPWAERFPYALYNCLTAALFLHRNHDGSRQIAEMMLSEANLGPEAEILRTCAQVALDFINIRDGNLSVPADEGRDTPLPAPYEELRRKLIEAFVPKPDKRRRKTSNPTVEKLAKQFNALPSAKNSAPYTNFLKTADALVEETKGSASAPVFKTVRDVAFIMSEIARNKCHARDPNYVAPRANSPLRPSHPVLLTMWEYMCKLGGRKYGGDWERAARAARMSLVSSNEEFKPAYRKLMELADNSPGEDLPITAERNYGGWTEQERYILIFLAIAEQGKRNPDFIETVPLNTLLKWFKTLGDIGRRRRSEGAWHTIVRLAFEDLIMHRDGRTADLLSKEDLPFECMTAPTIIAMVLYGPLILGRVKDRLGTRLPLCIEERDEKILDDFFSDMVFPVSALRMTSDLLDPRGRESLFRVIIISIIRTEISNALHEERYRPTLWNSISQAHIALFAENLPDDSRLGAFCRLCLGKKHMNISDDPSKTAAFFASTHEKDPLHGAELSLFLMTWPGISAEFLLRLFESSFDGHVKADEWGIIPKMASMVTQPEDRKKLARGISRILKRRFKGNMNSSVKFAVKTLDSLEKSGELTENYEDEFDDLDDSDRKKLFEMFVARLLPNGAGPGNPFTQGRTGAQKGRKKGERLGKILFPDEDD
jgi:hypothetical protein